MDQIIARHIFILHNDSDAYAKRISLLKQIFRALFILSWLDLLLYLLIFPVFEATATALTQLKSVLSIPKHNRSLQPISQVYDLASHSTYVVYVNFIHEFKVDSERQILEKLFMAILFILRVFASHLLRRRRRRYIFVLMSDLWFELGRYV